MNDHLVLGIILGLVAAAEIFFGVWTIWLVRDTSLKLSRLVIQETNKIPGKLTVRE